MWTKTRPFRLVLSLLFLTVSFGGALAAPSPRIVALTHPIDTYRSSKREAENRIRATAYADRLRADADRFNQETDCINALARLTEAAKWDEPGDHTPHVEQMRATLRTKIALLTTLQADDPQRADAPSVSAEPFTHPTSGDH